MGAELTKYVVVVPSPSENVQGQQTEFTDFDDAVAYAINNNIDPSTISTVVEDIPEDGI